MKFTLAIVVEDTDDIFMRSMQETYYTSEHKTELGVMG